MKALIFGAAGQDGYYLARLLRERAVEPICVSRFGSAVHGDVGRMGDVEPLIRDHSPEFVFHLAANSTTRHDALFENHATISGGTLNVLESVKRHCPEARVFIAGSGVQFRNEGRPIDETSPFEAGSAYSVARIQSVYAARYYRSIGIRVYVGYLFHHESPLRKAHHVSRLIADTAKRIGSGSGERLSVGDIGVVKEWTFAGDVAHAILELMSQTSTPECVIGSGDGHSIEEWLVECFGRVGLAWRDHVDVRRDFKAEYTYLVSAPRLLRSLGWEPTVSFKQLSAMMMAETP